MPFIGREDELSDLRAEFLAGRPSLVIVYGRRRIGKSTLLQQVALSASSAVYF
jgi:AAA+ ATPase superfamily predicted ATPase